MTADSKRRSFPEFAKLLSKEPGWADEESALQEILGAFLRREITDVTWPRGDIAYRPDGAHTVTIGQDSDGWPINVRPAAPPPQEFVTPGEWRVGLHSTAGGVLGGKCRDLDDQVIAKIHISEYPPLFRQAYIDPLHTTDAEIARWLQERSISVPEWLCRPSEPALVEGRKRDRRGERKHETRKKYQQWYDLAQEIKSEGEWFRPGEIASKIAKKVPNTNSDSIKRRLNEYYPGWAKTSVVSKPKKK